MRKLEKLELQGAHRDKSNPILEAIEEYEALYLNFCDGVAAVLCPCVCG